ncbi:hypothetical protein M885DRAFT_517685 [Pelagophyceae sp. CCMP2097]|nr:hypothetical protein M885DRAFT_517685 [Pelagophyceae sp. CCMP2097]
MVAWMVAWAVPLDSSLSKGPGDGPSVTVALTAAPKTVPWTVTRLPAPRLRPLRDVTWASPRKVAWTGPLSNHMASRASKGEGTSNPRLWQGTLRC